MKRYILVSVMIMIGSLMIAVSLQDTSNESQTQEQSTTTVPIFQREDAPIFEETDDTLAIPDPCVTISSEKIASFISPSKVRGPLLQTAVVPTKTCEWFPVEESVSEPRITLSIAANENYFDPLIESSVEELDIGSESHVVQGQSNAISAANCGKTIMVKIENYSFVVGLCKARESEVTSDELVDLAQEVLTSFTV